MSSPGPEERCHLTTPPKPTEKRERDRDRERIKETCQEKEVVVIWTS